LQKKKTVLIASSVADFLTALLNRDAGFKTLVLCSICCFKRRGWNYTVTRDHAQGLLAFS